MTPRRDASPGGVLPAPALPDTVVCPACFGGLTPGPEPTSPAWLRCNQCHRRYPVVDGIPVLLAGRANLDRR